jgi:predicted  nucleic acid-binding Zn-ribbon protein
MPKKSKTDITLEEFRRRKYKLMQEIDDINSGKRLESLSKELDDIKKSIERLTKMKKKSH